MPYEAAEAFFKMKIVGKRKREKSEFVEYDAEGMKLGDILKLDSTDREVGEEEEVLRRGNM